MEFDLGFHGQFQSPYLSTFFLENPTTTQPNNTLFQPNNTTCAINMSNHSESSSFIPVSASTLKLTAGVIPHASQSMMVNPFYGVSTPCLMSQSSFFHQIISSNEQFIKYFINPANINFEQENINASSHNPRNNFYNTGSDKFIMDFAQKTVAIPTQFAGTIASSSHPPTPPTPVSSGGNGSMLKLRMKENLARRIKKNNQQANGSGKMRRQSQRAKAKNDSKSSFGITKGQWTPDEDRVLKELVNKHGLKKWSKIAMFVEGRRTGKQCRERWYNHLQQNIKKGPWTLEEDIMLIKAHMEFGNKWAKIARKIPGRPENTIKNHWNVTKRSKNIKTYNKTTDEYDDSVLRTYIKDVAAATTSQIDKKTTTTKKKKKCEEQKKKNEPPISKGKVKALMFSG